MDRLAVPIIDVNGFKADTWFERLHLACAEWGCLQIVNHGIEVELLRSIHQQQIKLFSLADAQKRAIERTDINPWGYFDRELTKNQRDWKEIYDIGPASVEGPFEAQPQWPVGLTEFRTIIELFFTACESIAKSLLGAISRNLEMEEGDLNRFFLENSSFLRLNHYPRCTEPTKHLGISPHTDAGALTVLLQNNVSGLQFYHKDRWVSVEPIEGALTINIGDIVQVWSNDLYRAPLHRVLANSSRDRYSAVLFYNPSYDTDYAPLRTLLSESSPPRYRQINWGEFRSGRAEGDYADSGEEIQISRFRI